MKFFSQILALLILALIACEASAMENTFSIVVAPQGKSELVAKFSSRNIRVTVSTHQVDVGRAGDHNAGAGNLACTQSRSPCSVVDQLSIAINGKSIFIPTSVFSDVADINKMEAMQHGGEFNLMIYGGDASEGYILRIIFDGGRIKQRTLASSLLPNEILQETTYYQQVLGD